MSNSKQQQQMKRQEMMSNSPLKPLITNNKQSEASPKVDVKKPESHETVVVEELAYSKLKDSKISMETLINNAQFESYLLPGSFQIFQSKNILTLGDLCSRFISEINNLPFKLPKIDCFNGFIQKHEEIENELSKIDVTKSVTVTPLMGSVNHQLFFS